MKRQRKQRKIDPGSESKEEQKGLSGATELLQPEKPQSWYELHGQGVKSELDPNRGAYHEMEVRNVNGP